MADEQRKIEFTIDAKKAKKSLADLRKSQANLAESAVKSNKDFDKAASGIKDYGKTVKRSIGSLARQSKGLKDNTVQVEKQKRAYADLESQLDQIDEQFSRTSQLVGQAGDVGSAGRTIGGAIGAIGGDAGGQIESAISALSELPDTLEAIPRLQDSFKALPKIATLTADRLGLGGLAGSMQSLIPGLSAGTASTLAMAGAAAALAAPIIAVVLAMQNYNKQAEAQAKILTATIDANRGVRESIAEGLTSDEAEQRLAELRQLRESESGELGRLNAAYQSMEEQLGIVSGVVKVFDSREQALADSIKDGNAAIAGYDAEIKALEKALGEGALATNDAAISEEELINAREKTIAAIDNQIRQAENNAAQALARANQIGEQIQASLDDRAQAQADATEQEALEAKFAAEDAAKEEETHRDRLAQIASDGRERIESLEEGFADLANERADALAKVDQKGNEKLANLRGDYFKSQTGAAQDFNRDIQKLNSDSAKRIKKINDDLLASLQDAERGNNVIAFLEAQRKAEEQINEEKKNAKDIERERYDEFIRRQQEERAAFQEKQAEILANIETEKQAVVESYNEKRIALQEQIEEERAAIAERQAQEEARYQEQLAREAEQAARQAERDALREKQEQEAFNKRLHELRQQQAEEQAKHAQELANAQQLATLKQQAHSAELSALQQLEAAAQRVAQAASSAGSRSSRSGGSRFGYGSQGFGAASRNQTSLSSTNTTSRFGYRSSSFNAFHDGGRVDFKGSRREGFAFVEKGERIISNDELASPSSGGLPLSMAQGERAQGGNMGRPIQITVPVNATVGDVATQSMLNEGMVSTIETVLYDVLEPTLMNALAGNR